MKEEAATAALLRQFLLGKIEDEERQRIESLFLTDSLMRERVLAAEQELIDDYLEDRLSTADQQIFLSLYGDTAAQQRKLRIAKSIQDWAVTQSKAQPVRPKPAISAWSRLLETLRLKPVFVIPIAVTAIVGIVLALVWVNSRSTERQREYLVMQQELAQLNTPLSLRDVRPQMLLTLKPGSFRSVERQSELKIRPDTTVAELRLLWMHKEDYPNYRALLHLPGADQPYTLSDLTAENEDGKFIRLRLPARKLTRGNYEIELSGISADGTPGPTEVYNFTLSE